MYKEEFEKIQGVPDHPTNCFYNCTGRVVKFKFEKIKKLRIFLDGNRIISDSLTYEDYCRVFIDTKRNCIFIESSNFLNEEQN